MRILLHEYATGGGSWSDDLLAEKLLDEARAMVRAASGDLSRIPGMELVRLEDVRLASSIGAAGHVVPIRSATEEFEQLAGWARRADGTILIAPETAGRLLDRCRLVQRSGGRLLSPDAEFVAIASDKHRLGARLTEAGVPTPAAVLIEPGQSFPATFPLPAVLKPIDGAGSVDTRLVRAAEDVRGRLPCERPMRLERYCSGIAASVAALCGPHGPVLLPAGRQIISDDGFCRYLGGEIPLNGALSRRAQQLAGRTLAALPPTVGYVGIDMILGADETGADDRVLEVNPRLTTSYVGLRGLAHMNLAEAMLAHADGHDAPLTFRPGAIRFDADGRIW
ncbi:MAG: ATP-grasp domain-containing protein [Planctomycetes bacterium]|nr:ATP-grasp domain-containing protein [Planctomycetota bacterium]